MFSFVLVYRCVRFDDISEYPLLVSVIGQALLVSIYNLPGRNCWYKYKIYTFWGLKGFQGDLNPVSPEGFGIRVIADQITFFLNNKTGSNSLLSNKISNQ